MNKLMASPTSPTTTTTRLDTRHSPEICIHILSNQSSPRINSLAAAISKGEGELSVLRHALSSLENSLNMEKRKIDEYKTEKNKENKTLMSKLKEERSQRRSLRDDLACASQIIEKQAMEITELTCALRESHVLTERLHEVLVDKKKEAEGLRAENDQLSGTLHRVEEALSFAKLELSREQFTIATQREQLNAARDTIQRQANTLSLAAEEGKKLKNKITALENDQKVQKKANEELQKTLQNTQARLCESTEALATNSARFRAVTDEKRDLMQQIRNLKRKDSIQVGQISALQRQMDDMQVSIDAALKTLNTQLEAASTEKRVAVTEAERSRRALVAVIRGFEEVSAQLSSTQRR